MAKESITDILLEGICFLEEDDNHYVHSQKFAVSDSEYAETLQLQESIMASIISSQNPNNTPSSSNRKRKSIGNGSGESSYRFTPSSSNYKRKSIGDGIGESSYRSTPSSSNHKRKKIGNGSGESSYRFCEICVDKKQNHEMFRVQNCSHSFCSDCIRKYISLKLQQNVTAVTCPGLDCDGVLELEKCKVVIPKDVVDRWDKALTESLIPASRKLYCPFKDCSAVMDKDEAKEVIREAECLECRRLFCAQCLSPWHSGINCEAFQKLNVDERGREDLMFRDLAKRKNWARCPHCKFYVEKNQGCLHIICRCKFEFCYACGKKWSLLHSCRRRSTS